MQRAPSYRVVHDFENPRENFPHGEERMVPFFRIRTHATNSSRKRERKKEKKREKLCQKAVRAQPVVVDVQRNPQNQTYSVDEMYRVSNDSPYTTEAIFITKGLSIVACTTTENRQQGQVDQASNPKMRWHLLHGGRETAQREEPPRTLHIKSIATNERMIPARCETAFKTSSSTYRKPTDVPPQVARIDAALSERKATQKVSSQAIIGWS